MIDPLARGKGDPLIRGLIALIGIHSCALGTLMLFAPRFTVRAFGFSQTASVFFPSQGGVFLLILGICYLLALSEPALVKVILISKAFAVVFLFAHAAFLSAPPSIWAAAAGDAAMLVALSAALFRGRRLTCIRSPHPASLRSAHPACRSHKVATRHPPLPYTGEGAGG